MNFTVMRGKTVLKAPLISLGVSFVSLVAVALYVVATALTHVRGGGAGVRRRRGQQSARGASVN